MSIVAESSESSAHLALQKVGTDKRNNNICKHTIHRNRSVASIDQSHNVEPPLIESDRHNHNSNAAENSADVAEDSNAAVDSGAAAEADTETTYCLGVNEVSFQLTVFAGLTAHLLAFASKYNAVPTPLLPD